MTTTKNCIVCGSSNFSETKVLWEELILDWELNNHQVKYIDRQQGLSCVSCGNNLRSMVLAKAILCNLCSGETLTKAAGRFRYRNLRVLEINQAGNLSPHLAKFPKHTLLNYPEGDMMNLEYDDGTWDLVVHSETLEHVADPMKGLIETIRILKTGGACIFTIPIIVEKMTRSREGLKDSFHGDPKNTTADYRVVTEFGADAWTFVMSAGFSSCRIHTIDYPAGIAIEAIK
jgi:SAM-dependent methyltransferase